jgi:hypothetical protein
LPSDQALRALVEATEERDPFAMLERACAVLVARCGARRSRRRSGGQGATRSGGCAADAAPVRAQILAALPPVIAVDPRLPLARALRGEEHAGERRIRADLRRTGLYQPTADAHAEVGRFLRDWLFALEPYRFPTLAAGLFAAGLAAAEILRDLPRRAAHPKVRTRIIQWESALAAGSFAHALRPDGPLSDRVADLEDVRAQLRAWAGTPNRLEP